MINLLKEVLLQNWLGILIFLFCAIGLICLWKRGKKDLVKKILYGLVVQAEKALGSGTGLEKKAMVLSSWYAALPWYIRLLFTQTEVAAYIEDGVSYLKKRLAEGVDLTSYDLEIPAECDTPNAAEGTE